MIAGTSDGITKLCEEVSEACDRTLREWRRIGRAAPFVEVGDECPPPLPLTRPAFVGLAGARAAAREAKAKEGEGGGSL